MDREQLKHLFETGLLRERQYRLLDSVYSRKIVSLFYEIRALLYLGVLMFAAGAGILLYKNTDKLGHEVNIILLSAVMLACFLYAAKHRPPFTREMAASPTPLYDYILLLGALLFVAIEGYLQAVYEIFGTEYGLAAAVPALFFYLVAYLFDHRGVLALAITATASAIGLEISVVRWVESNVFREETLILPAIFLGAGLIVAGQTADFANCKRHFTFTYLLWGATLLFCGLLAALFKFDLKFLTFLILALVSVVSAVYARRKQIFIFYLYGVLFGYIGLTYMLIEYIDLAAEFWMLYFIASGGGLIYFIISTLRTFRQK